MILIKKLSNLAVIPSKKRSGDAGFDLYSIEDKTLKPGERYQFKLGLAMEMAIDRVAIIEGRSGNALKYGITTIGNVIDSNYRGEFSVIMVNTGDKDFEVKIGDRIAQMIIYQLPYEKFIEVTELSDSDRGENGFGSSGK